MAAWLRRSAMDCAARLLAQALVSAPNCLRLIMFAPYALSRRQSLMAVEGTREEQRVEEVIGPSDCVAKKGECGAFLVQPKVICCEH